MFCQQCGVLGSILIIASCASSPPEHEWQQLCEAETGRFVYEAHAPTGLADPYGIGHGKTDLLLGSGAEWVEVNHHENTNVPISARSKIYTSGTGRYVVRFKDVLDPICKSQIAQWGFDPETLNRAAPNHTNKRLNGNALDAACLTAVRVGDPIPRASWFAAEPDPAILEKYDAHYAIVLNRERFFTPEDGRTVFRKAAQILDSRTRDVIAEEVSLYYYSSGPMASEIVCGPARDQRPSGWRTMVFR